MRLCHCVGAYACIPGRRPRPGVSPWRSACWPGLRAWLAPRSAWLSLPALTGWGYSRNFPRPASKSFHARWPELAQQAPLTGETVSNTVSLAAAIASDSKVETLERSNVRTGSSDLLERFSQELINLGGEVTCCAPAELAERVLAFLETNQVRRLLAWQAPYLPLDILEALQRAGVEVVHQPDPQAQAGLTGALVGLAETGTLVLPSGPDRPATASLLPEIHLAILRREDILPNLESLLAGWFCRAAAGRAGCLLGGAG